MRETLCSIILGAADAFFTMFSWSGVLKALFLLCFREATQISVFITEARCVFPLCLAYMTCSKRYFGDVLEKRINHNKSLFLLQKRECMFL